MPSRFDSAPPKSAAFFLSFFLFVSNSLYHSTLIRPLSTVAFCRLCFVHHSKLLPQTLHLYMKFTDFQLVLHSLVITVTGTRRETWRLSSSLRRCFLPFTCRVPPILKPFLRFYQNTLEDHTWHESLNILVGATAVLKKGLSNKNPLRTLNRLSIAKYRRDGHLFVLLFYQIRPTALLVYDVRE